MISFRSSRHPCLDPETSNPLDVDIGMSEDDLYVSGLFVHNSLARRSEGTARVSDVVTIEYSEDYLRVSDVCGEDSRSNGVRGERSRYRWFQHRVRL